jgi:lysophospholipase L1-like esterase
MTPSPPSSRPGGPTPAPPDGRTARPAAKARPRAGAGHVQVLENEPRPAANGKSANRHHVEDVPDPALIDKQHRVAGEVFGQPSGIRSSAGRCLGVGLLCFFLWVLFDANQLYNSANASPAGTRRSVAVAILRPVAAVSNFLHLSGLVNWGDSLLGRTGAGTVGQDQSHLPSVTIPTGSGDQNLHSLNGATPLPHRPGQYITTPSGPSFNVPPLVQPTPSHPLTILDIGDSIGEDLGFGLGDVFTGNRYVNVIQKGVEDTGLDQPQYWNWPGHLEQDVQKYHPGAVVIMMGANDDQNLDQKGSNPSAFCTNFAPPCVVQRGTVQWVQDYTARVRLLMEESLLAGAHVIWVGLPPMGGGNVTSGFAQAVNRIAQQQAAMLPDVTYVSSWDLLSSHGHYAEYKTIGGSQQQIRSSDGVHLLPAGYDLLAGALVDPMQKAWKIDLHVAR